ncbi:MAG: ATP-binding protein [Chryseolinea sp.]
MPITENEVTAGFRLQNLEVLNWGTFHHKIWDIHPDGSNSLLTGDIGSGKSTLVDALTSLLVPHHKITFNKAAGAESKERSLKSYVRGEYKKEKLEYTNTAKEVYLRPEANTYSILIANFADATFNEKICLTQIFWMKEDKVEKMLLVSVNKPLSIIDHFSSFTDIPELKKRLKAETAIEIFDDNFSKYSERFRRLFGMNSDKAIDLFYQTVSMKAVSSLTDFVRDHMLEKTDVKARMDELKKRFDDLNKAHQAVVTAREQIDILRPLVENAVVHGKLDKNIKEIDRIMTLIPGWFAERKVALLETEINECEHQLLQTQNQLDLVETSLHSLKMHELQLRQDIHDNGGKRLEEIDKEIKLHETLKSNKLSISEAYERLCLVCNIRNVDSEKQFYQNIKDATQALSGMESRQQILVEERDGLKSEERNLKLQIDSEVLELESLNKRKNQIPEYMVNIREQIAADLNISESEIPFIGELLKVRDEEQEWEGAIERLLHSYGMSMIVPVHLYNRVSVYVNNTTLQSKDGRRQRLVYFKADELNYKSRNARTVRQDSVVDKLEIKPETEFEEWLYDELVVRYNYACVSFEDFRKVPDAITKEGQIKSGGKRHEKDDRRKIHDRLQYVLGWSNTQKKKALENSIEKSRTDLRSVNQKIKTVEQEMANNKVLEKNLDAFLRIDNFADIDWQSENKIIELLKSEKRELETSSDVLQSLQRQLEEVLKKTGEDDVLRKVKTEELGKLKNNKEKYYADLKSGETEALSFVNEPDREAIYLLIEVRASGINLTVRNIDSEQRNIERKLSGDDSSEKSKLLKDQSKFIGKIIGKMKDIKGHSSAETSEMAADMEALPEYLTMYERVANDDLPRHEKRFKEELNKNTIQSIAIFSSKLESFEKDIQEKIEEINKHLREIEYDSSSGTYIKILTDPTLDRQIGTFKQDLKNCFSYSFGDMDELYTEEKYGQVKKLLDRFNSAQSIDIEWTSKVTDVRQWFDFNASERYSQDNTEKEFFPGSSGKSGGQKEKLAYTILASALAFQFGLVSGESKSRSFRFVVIDEAFGRGSDESTRYGLELFRKLNLQLLIVTPLQKINIIENYVNTVHFVSNKDGNNSQVRNLTYTEYVQEKIKRQLQSAS